MKRFTDTEMWAKPWFRRLPPPYKAFWQYLRDKCDNSGVWVKDLELASVYIGETIDEEKALALINNGKERIRIFDNGEKWLIVEFVFFQCGITSYKELSIKSNPHLQILRLLRKYGLFQGYGKGRANLKDQDQDQDQDKDKDKDLKKGDIKGKTKPPVFDFEAIWAKYPKKVGKEEARQRFKVQVKTEQDWKDINAALKNYVESERVAVRDVVQDGSTWFNWRWKDWRVQREPVCPKCKNTGKYVSDQNFDIICDCPAGKKRRV